MEIVLIAGFCWVVGGSIFYLLIETRSEQWVYKPKEIILYENKAQHHFVITGKYPPVRLTQDQAFTNALIAAAQERRTRKRK